jgi:hypothetical protein
MWASTPLAQGLINAQNAAAEDIYTVNPPDGSTALIAGSAAATYDFEVLTAPSTLPTGPLAGYGVPGGGLHELLSAPWSDTGLMFHNSGIAGRVSAPIPSVVNNWPSETAQDFIVVGWSANLGTWSQVAADLQGAALVHLLGGGSVWVGPNMPYSESYIGATVVGDVISGPAGSGAGPNIFGAVATGVSPIDTTTALYFTDGPEPTTLTLMALGAAAILIFRRRK